MDKLRRCRRKHLAPLGSMTVGEITIHIGELNLNQLRALKRAMDSCTTTNCGWWEYDIAGLFYSRVQEAISVKEIKRAKRKSS